MPTLGPSLLFAAGLALGVGTGILLPTSSKRSETVSPPVPVNSSADRRNPSPITPPGSGPVQGGFPGPIPDILKRTAYTAAYDRRLRHPSWTAEHLTAAKLGRAAPNIESSSSHNAKLTDASSGSSSRGDRSKSTFIEDEAVPEAFRSRLQDYYRSGYDRGHMVPAADAKVSQLAMDETFYLSNIAPQIGDGFNRHYWAYVEDFCRRLTTNFEDVYVFTVPLYIPTQYPDGKWRITHEVIGNPPAVSVPTHFAKVILASRPDFSYPQRPSDTSISSSHPIVELAMGAFILPNQTIPDEADLRSFIAPVEVVERAAGLQLFNDDLKSKSRQLCAVTQCQVIVRRFDEANKSISGGRTKSKA